MSCAPSTSASLANRAEERSPRDLHSARPLARGPARGLFALWAALVLPCWAASDLPPQAAIATAHPLATGAGLQILSQGGNAFDAAVAVAAVLAVVEPYGSGLGGGGFWLLHRASDGLQTMIDGRERAPLAARRDMYLGPDGRFLPDLALNGPLAAGIPGMPAALCHLSEQYGRLGLSKTLAPAIRQAREGFELDERYRQMATSRLDVLRAWPATASQYLAANEVPVAGYRLTQPDLARTLSALAAEGCAAFYQGAVAERLVAGVREAGGLWTLEDLKQYRVIERAPIRASFRGWTIASAAPPSSGGVLLVQMLNMLEAMPRSEDRVTSIHALAEVMRRAYRDRGTYLGDPDQVEMPIARLTDLDYAAGLIRDYDPEHATPSRPVACDEPLPEGQDTTHYSILDEMGNRVAATLSVNYPFGSGFVPPGTGVLLNDEMDDFSAQPGIANAYGLLGGEANSIAPGKRMLSSMTPTFVESAQGVAILGTPGGSRIISMVLQGVLAAVEGAPVVDWVGRPRVHHQYLPDRLQAEPGALSLDERATLESMGHRVDVLPRPYGNMQAIYWDRTQGRVTAASDPRGIGSAQAR